MPLHLLPKKSWNPYAPAAIARVRADEALAAEASERQEEALRVHEAATRMALLRGEEAPTPPPEEQTALKVGGAKRERDGDAWSWERDDKRRRRRLQGEDDTDRDIRVAREEEAERVGRRDMPGGQGDLGAAERLRMDQAPLVDYKGHIQLFAPPGVKEIKKEKREEGEREKKRRRDGNGDGDKERSENVGGMRFSDAAGYRQKISERPWYASASGYSGTEEVDLTAKKGHDRDGDLGGTDGGIVGKNAFGNEDAGRFRRDASRLHSADPMAAMKSAQAKLKTVERKRKEVEDERRRELEALKEEQDRDERRERRRRRRKEEQKESYRRGEQSRTRDRSHGRSRHQSPRDQGRACIET